MITLAAALTGLVARQLPAHIDAGSLLLGSSALLLLQGLIRDLWLMAKRKQQAGVGDRRKALCMCVESTLGVTGVAAGLIILGSALDLPLHVAPWAWGALVLAVLATGFAIKDFVLEWRPFRLRRDKDHVNIVFSWKR